MFIKFQHDLNAKLVKLCSKKNSRWKVQKSKNNFYFPIRMNIIHNALGVL